MRVRPWLIASAILFCSACSGALRSGAPADPRTPWIPPAHALVDPGTATQPAYPPEAIPRDEKLDLAQVVDIALTNDPDTSRAWLDAKRAAAQRMQTFALYLPEGSVDFQASWIKLDIDERLARGHDYDATNWGPGANVGLLLFDFFGREASVAAATRSLDAANFGFNQTLQDTVAAVATEYYQLWAALESRTAAAASLVDAEASLKAAQAKHEAGLAPIQDVYRARARYEDARYEVAATRTEVESARARLAASIGLEAIADLEIRAPELPSDHAALLESVEDATARALSVKPSLLASYARFAAAEELTRTAQSQLFPQLVAAYSADWSWGDFTNDPSEHQTAYASVQWNVFDLFRNYYAFEEAQLEAQQAATAARAAELQTAANVWSDWWSFRSSIEQARAREAALEAAEATWTLTRTSYDAGLSDILDLLTAQVDLANAREADIAARARMATSLIQLAHATGTLQPGEPAATGAPRPAPTPQETR